MMRTICAWCVDVDALQRLALGQRVSHGICDACLERVTREEIDTPPAKPQTLEQLAPLDPRD